MLSHSSSHIPAASNRKAPTCTRCRNHGIYNVQLKGHRNVCKFRLCTCKHCILIVQRRLMVVKPDREQTESGGKSSKKKRSSKKVVGMDKKNDGEGLISNPLPTAITQRKEHPQFPVANLEAVSLGEVPVMKQSSANLPRKQLRLLPADGAAHMTSLPVSHYYGFMYCTPRMEMRNFNPSSPSSISMASPRVSSPSSSGMMIPVAEQPHMVGNFPVTRTRGFTINSPAQLNMTIPRPMEHF